MRLKRQSRLGVKKWERTYDCISYHLQYDLDRFPSQGNFRRPPFLIVADIPAFRQVGKDNLDITSSLRLVGELRPTDLS